VAKDFLETAPAAKRSAKQDKTVYIPWMSDHCHALKGVMDFCDIKGEILPPYGENDLEYGRRYTGGGECLPFILTTGGFIRLIKETPDFVPQKSILLMPTSSGPCRFGQYFNVQKLIFEKLGYKIEMISLESYDSYTMKDLGTKFRRTAWYGVLAVDLIQKSLWKIRPYEVKKGETDKIYKRGLMKIQDSLAKGGINKLLEAIKTIVNEFSQIQTRKETRPLIGVVGEFYVRTNTFSNSNIVRKIEKLGGEARVAPVSEWLYYTNRKKIQDTKERKEFLTLMKTWAEKMVQIHDEKKIDRYFATILDNEDIHEPSISKIVEASDPYIKEAYRGEPVLDVGKAIDYIAKGADGIINLTPFSCMPGIMVRSVSNLIRSDHQNLPWLNLTFDGQKHTNLMTRLEAFIFQANKFKLNKENHKN
jgi:predicted nucleotide-binding protein (sugar kinase/HSP70/actin superfamily)